jgi:YfiH family protein
MFMTLPQPTDAFEWTQAPWGITLRCRPLLDVADHFFTTGDLSLGADDPAWAMVAREIGVDRENLLLVRQVHRADVAIARPGRATSWQRPEADVIISDDPASAIGVRVADCAPILLADGRLRAVAAVHAGWRGTMHGAAAAAVRAMTAAFNSQSADLVAAIGPCLGVCCGEVGSEVVDAFRAAGHAESSLERWFETGASGRPYLDLARANRDQLVAAGVPNERIYAAGICTKTHSGVLHSYRARGNGAGRMAGVIRALSLEP